MTCNYGRTNPENEHRKHQGLYTQRVIDTGANNQGVMSGTGNWSRTTKDFKTVTGNSN